MSVKMIPATIADKPFQGMRFEAVIFILPSLMTEVSRLVFMCLSPSIVAVFVAAFILSLVALVAIVFLLDSLVYSSGRAGQHRRLPLHAAAWEAACRGS